MMKKYIEWLNSTEYQVCVGQYGQESFFQKNDGQKLITAQRGEDGHGTRPVGSGGNGYSGGGHGSNKRGGGSTKGGSDGSDGEGSPYGECGSGFDISTISLEYHTLNQGNGGEPYGYHYGGGVLVDDVGPSYGTNQGEGYGGGGANGYDSGLGLQGMILIEAKPKT